MTTAIARKPRAVKAPKIHTVRTTVTNQTERDCGYDLVVLVEFEKGAWADRIISGTINGEYLTISFQTEIEAESYLHNLACDRIAADAQERDLAVEAVEYQIEQFVAEVAAAQPAEVCILCGAGKAPYCPNGCTIPMEPAGSPGISYSAFLGGFTFDEKRAYPSIAAAKEARTALSELVAKGRTEAAAGQPTCPHCRTELVADGYCPRGCTPLPHELPPYIFYSPTFGDCGLVANSYIDAEIARTEMLAELA